MRINSKNGFGSDNHATVHPQYLASFSEVNTGHTPSYGTDPWTEELQLVLKKEFGPKAEGFLVFNGTGANVTALKALTRDFEAVLVSETAHIFESECGAPERIGGFKVIPLPHKNGKLQLETLQKSLIRRGDQHYSQVKTISLTQPTEYGTCYSIEEIKAITDWAHKEGLKVHMDGARLGNAAASLQTTLAGTTSECGIDAISLGGTKNGLMFGELVIFPNGDPGKNFKYLRKQAMQLPSKSRYLSSQFLTYFKNEFWRELADHSIALAKTMEKELKLIPEIQITQPVESNAVFVIFPKALVKPLRENFFFYVWDENTFECRLMISWDTQHEEIQDFANAIKNIIRGINTPT
jgi:threonine aldolase